MSPRRIVFTSAVNPSQPVRACTRPPRWRRTLALFAAVAGFTPAVCVAAADAAPAVAASAPALRINGPSVFGVRPGNPFFYAIPATGQRPVQFSADGLPDGLELDAATGVIHGRLASAGDYAVLLRVRNNAGSAERKFTIKCGEQICLTPPMGWNSWNCWAESVSEEKVVRSARAMVASGLAEHGWSYINIDDGWQGHRGGPLKALQANEKFPDMKRLCDEVHALGLRVGIYSTPWTTSYAGYCGGSADDATGKWTAPVPRKAGHRHGAVSFADADARQYAEWGFDYLKYDWNPIDVPHATAMAQALRKSGRDIAYSLSNAADPRLMTEWAKIANCWRTTGDIGDHWAYGLHGMKDRWRWGVSEIGFSQDKWAPAAGPGHWNDPDMLVVGQVGWGPSLHATHLSPDEQYSHISLWCMLSAPLLIGCDLEQLDPLTLELLTNDEVLALDQDALGRQAVRVATLGSIDIFMKPLEDGGTALGFFNRGDSTAEFMFNKLGSIGLGGRWHARDLWRHTDLPDCNGEIGGKVAAHGVWLLKLTR